MVDVDDFVEVVEPGDLVVGRGLFVRAVDGVGGCGVQRVVDQRGFARARHARDAGEQAHWHIHVDVLEVVAARASDANDLVFAGLLVEQALCGQLIRGHRQKGVAFGRHLDAQGLCQVAPSE